LNKNLTKTKQREPKTITTSTHPNCAMKRVILITGTPCTGKTTVANDLAQKLSAQYINLTAYAKNYHLTFGEDTRRKTTIINEEKMRIKLAETLNSSENTNIIIDGHYAAAVTPTNLVTHVFVLRRNPKELKRFMQKCGFNETKIYENLSAEILDICLIEAIQNQKGKVCELDITGKTLEETVTEIFEVLDNDKKCLTGIVDWLGMLERENITDQYLKT
jgi:adenylate kinase